MEGINNFGIPSTNLTEKSSDFPQIVGSSNCKRSIIESSCEKFEQNMESSNKILATSLPPRPTSCSSIVLPPPTTYYPRPRFAALDKAVEHELKHGRQRFDPNMDMKKLRRIVSNKLSAQRAKLKNAQYILEMEKIAESLQDQVSVLTPQVRIYEERRTLLALENDYLHQKTARFSNESTISEMELELNNLEINRLRELFVHGENEPLHELSSSAQYTPYLSWKQFTAQTYNHLGCAIVVSPIGLQLVSNSGTSQHSNEEQLLCLVLNQPDESLTIEVNEDDEIDMDQNFKF